MYRCFFFDFFRSFPAGIIIFFASGGLSGSFNGPFSVYVGHLRRFSGKVCISLVSGRDSGAFWVDLGPIFGLFWVTFRTSSRNACLNTPHAKNVTKPHICLCFSHVGAFVADEKFS